MTSEDTSLASRETMIAQFEALPDAQIAEMLEALRLRREAQFAPDAVTDDDATKASNDDDATRTAASSSTPTAGGIFSKRYADNRLAAGHAALFANFDAVYDAETARHFFAELSDLAPGDRPCIVVCSGGRQPTLHVLHGVARFPRQIARPSRHDSELHAFLGDAFGTSTPASIRVDPAWFVTADHPTPSIKDFEKEIEADPTSAYISTADTTGRVAQACLLPSCFAPYLLNKPIGPVQAWPILRAASDRTRIKGSLSRLWTWIMAVADDRNDTTRVDVIVPVAEDETFAAARTAVRVAICPTALAHAPAPAAVGAQQSTDSAATAAVTLLTQTLNTAFRKNTASSVKGIAQRWPYQLDTLKRLWNVTDPSLAPPMWTVLATEKRGAGARAVVSVACTNLAAKLGFRAPIITHEIGNKVHGLDLVPDDTSDLLQGASIWLFSVLLPAEATAVLEDTRLWDEHLQGSSNPTFADTRQALKQARLAPVLTFVPMYAMVCSYEVFMSVILGEAHDAVLELRATREALWSMHIDLERKFLFDRKLASQIITEIRLQFVGYLRSVFHPRGRVMLPVLTEMIDDLRFERWRPPPLPAPLAQLLNPPQGPTRQPAPAFGLTPPQRPAPAPAPAPALALPPHQPRGPTEPQVPVMNPTPVAQWQVGTAALRPMIDQAKQLGSGIPKADNGMNICLTYQFKGRCYSLCRGRSTHRRLSAAEYQRVNMWHSQFCSAATPPQPPPVPSYQGYYTQPALPRPAPPPRPPQPPGQGPTPQLPTGRGQHRSSTPREPPPPMAAVPATTAPDTGPSTLGPDTARH